MESSLWRKLPKVQIWGHFTHVDCASKQQCSASSHFDWKRVLKYISMQMTSSINQINEEEEADSSVTSSFNYGDPCFASAGFGGFCRKQKYCSKTRYSYSRTCGWNNICCEKAPKRSLYWSWSFPSPSSLQSPSSSFLSTQSESKRSKPKRVWSKPKPTKKWWKRTKSSTTGAFL